MLKLVFDSFNNRYLLGWTILIKYFCKLDKTSKDLLKAAIEELRLSARAYDKILKVSRTITDLAGADDIKTEHLAEAIQYRTLDRNWWG